MVAIRGGAHICPLPECPGRDQPCPDRDRYTSRWQSENADAQHCVRELITQIGGTSNPETFWLVNEFEATVTWAQIEMVAAHPHVLRIGLVDSGSPPP
jgi:hypothetical protein